MYIDQNKIMNFSNNCFIKLGMPEEEANIITEVMLEADLRGIHSHVSSDFLYMLNVYKRG